MLDMLLRIYVAVFATSEGRHKNSIGLALPVAGASWVPVLAVTVRDVIP